MAFFSYGRRPSVGRLALGSFTPGAGVFPFHPDRFDHDWGRLLKEMMTGHPMSGIRVQFGST
jgi:hypothetical protein